MSACGCFIVVEGLEGAGKSTAVQTIENYLRPIVPELIVTREPGGTYIGEAIRQLIKQKTEEETLEPCSELLLLYAARVQLVEQVIRPALNRGCWVVADRFELSSFAYQGGGRHLELAMIQHLSTFCLQDFKPDLILFLDLSPEEGLLRVKGRGALDRIEQESLAFFCRVQHTYHQMIKTMNNVVCIDASRSIDAVQQSILTQLKRFVPYNAAL